MRLIPRACELVRVLLSCGSSAGAIGALTPPIGAMRAPR